MGNCRYVFLIVVCDFCCLSENSFFVDIVNRNKLINVICVLLNFFIYIFGLICFRNFRILRSRFLFSSIYFIIICLLTWIPADHKLPDSPGFYLQSRNRSCRHDHLFRYCLWHTIRSGCLVTLILFVQRNQIHRVSINRRRLCASCPNHRQNTCAYSTYHDTCKKQIPFFVHFQSSP